ncbi:ArgS-related anticodon-binding protein NrtL [Streptomyces sp. NPDC051940]|uniref:ArgS-related anticodon-binding protein NrtL n=1 Tax=Streptomyces sp. NPDC051940 TaxID=3155675 RepID=UPI003422AA6F
MTPAQLSRTVLRTVREAVADGQLDVAVPDRVAVERPRPGGRGDWATAAPLQLARAARRPPLEIAAILAHRLADDPAIAEVEVTGPGFLNLTLVPDARPDVVRDVLAQGTEYGHGTALTGLRYRLPAPTEPRAVRWAAALDRVLRAAGAAPAGDGDRSAPEEPVHVVPLPAHDPAAFTEDALTWASVRPAAQDHPRLDGGLLVQRESNPLFLVRYAHARAHALRRAARELGIAAAGSGPCPQGGTDVPGADGTPYRSTQGAHPALRTLVAGLPEAVESAARHRAPDRVARYAETLADELLAYLTRAPCLPRGDEPATAAHHERLRTAEAARTALANALALLGVSAPKRL